MERTDYSGAGGIANGVYDAVGVRLTDMPITPEKVVKALEKKHMEEEDEESQLVAGA